MQWKLILAGVVLAALGGLLAHDHWVTKRLNAAKRENATLQATIDQIEKARATEQADRRKADESAKSLEAELARIRSEPKLTGVRCRTIAPIMPREGGAATVAHDPATESVEGVPDADPVGPERDVSAGVDWYGTSCAATAATLRALQAWETARSH